MAGEVQRIADELYQLLHMIVRQERRTLALLSILGLVPSAYRGRNTSTTPLYVVYYACCRSIRSPGTIARAANAVKTHVIYYLKRLPETCKLSEEACRLLEAKLTHKV